MTLISEFVLNSSRDTNLSDLAGRTVLQLNNFAAAAICCSYAMEKKRQKIPVSTSSLFSPTRITVLINGNSRV